MLEDRKSLARAHVRKVKETLAALFSKQGSRRLLRAHMEREGIETLVGLARGGDKDAVEILRNVARGARGTSISVPTALHEFVWDCFIDGPPKAKSGSSLKDTGLRDLSIALLVKIVHRRYGLPEYVNVAQRGDPDGPMSACRLVGEELGLSERRVEAIWAKHKDAVTRARRPK